MFASNGEKMTDFDLFHPDRMASRILDMGDMMTLIEQAEKSFDQEQAVKAAAKLTGQGGEFTLDDFLEQMQQVRKLGSMSKIMGMLPGMGQFREQLENFDEREIDRIQAVIQSMTPAERANPKMIDGSRRARIATRLRPPGLRRQPARRPVLRGPQDDDVDGPRRRDARHARHARDGWRQARKAKPQPKKGKGAKRSGNPAKAAQEAAAPPRRRRPTRPTRSARPRRRGRLREGRRRARPAEGLLQVPEVSTHAASSTAPTSSAAARTGGGRTGPVPHAGCTRGCWSRTRRTTRWCWSSRARPRAGFEAGRDGHVRTVHAKGDGDETIVDRDPRGGRARRPGQVVTADRILQARVEGVGAQALSPILAALAAGLTAHCSRAGCWPSLHHGMRATQGFPRLIRRGKHAFDCIPW